MRSRMHRSPTRKELGKFIPTICITHRSFCVTTEWTSFQDHDLWFLVRRTSRVLYTSAGLSWRSDLLSIERPFYWEFYFMWLLTFILFRLSRSFFRGGKSSFWFNNPSKSQKNLRYKKIVEITKISVQNPAQLGRKRGKSSSKAKTMWTAYLVVLFI